VVNTLLSGVPAAFIDELARELVLATGAVGGTCRRPRRSHRHGIETRKGRELCQRAHVDLDVL
jgi:hypothetical protein